MSAEDEIAQLESDNEAAAARLSEVESERDAAVARIEELLAVLDDVYRTIGRAL